MTTSAQTLTDAVNRIKETSRRAADGLSERQLEARLDPEANTIAWLLWHLARVQDAQVADVAGREELWIAHGWAPRFELPFDDRATGYGHSPDDVAAVRGLSSELLIEYVNWVCDHTIEYLGTLSDSDLDAVIDERFSPPVTLSARLVSIISDDLQHAGQAAFIRGVVERQAR
jgi:hypothetical protein